MPTLKLISRKILNNLGNRRKNNLNIELTFLKQMMLTGKIQLSRRDSEKSFWRQPRNIWVFLMLKDSGNQVKNITIHPSSWIAVP